MNQNVEDKEIQEFIIMNRLINAYKYMNNILDRELDNTHEWGSKCIDMVATI